MQEGESNSNKISNYSKISQLHQRIKMLDNQRGGPNMQSKDISFASQGPIYCDKEKQSEIGFNFRQINSPSNKSYLNNDSRNIGNKNQSLNINSPLSPTYQVHENKNNSSLSFNQKPGHKKQLNPQNDLYPLQAKYAKIQEKFVKFKIQQQNLIHNIERQIIEVNDQVKAFKRDCDRMQLKNEQVSEHLQRQLNDEISQMGQEMKQTKKGVVTAIDKKYKTIKTEMMSHIYEQFTVTCQTAAEQLGKQIQILQKRKQQDKNIRDEVSQLLINTFGDQILKLEQALNLERQTRKQRNNQVFEMIFKLQNKLATQITKQRRQTNSHIQMLQNTLEEVCYKIQQKILGR